MVLLFKSDKNLIITKQTKLLQQENAVDKVCVFVPEKYEDLSLEDFLVTFYYVDPANVVHTEILNQVDSTKEGFFQYQFPVDSSLTKLAGTIVGHLSFTHVDQETSVNRVLHSHDVSITIDAWEDYYRFYPDNALTALDNKLLEVDNDIQKLRNIGGIYAANQVDDLAITDGILQVTAGGVPVGEGVEIVTSVPDPDGTDDGQIDVDNIPEGTDEVDFG